MEESNPPPAKGLQKLTWYQVEQIDQYIAQVCEAGEGEVMIQIRRGKTIFISPRPSIRLSPSRS